MKKFIICTAIFMLVIVSLFTTLACIKPQTKLTYAEPIKIKAYNKNGSVAINSGTEYKPETGEGHIIYRELKNKTADIFNLSMFDYAIHGNNIFPTVRIDLSGEYADWSSSLYSKYYAVMFNFEEKQRQIVEFEGNTKIVEFYSFVVLMDNTKDYQEILIYYCEKSNSTNFEDTPMIVYGDPSKLIEYIDSIC